MLLFFIIKKKPKRAPLVQVYPSLALLAQAATPYAIFFNKKKATAAFFLNKKKRQGQQGQVSSSSLFLINKRWGREREEQTYQFLFPFFLNQLSIEIPQASEEIVLILSNIFILCLLFLISFLNVLKDFCILYLLLKYKNTNNLEERYPILKKFPIIRGLINKTINRFEKLSLLYIFFEIIFVLVLLIFLLVYCYLKIYSLCAIS
jgi:hypothetical protein